MLEVYEENTPPTSDDEKEVSDKTIKNATVPLKQPVVIPPSLSSEEDDLYEECTVDAFLSKKSNVMAPKVEATSSNTSSGRIVERVGGVSEGKGRKNGKTGDTNMRGPPRQRDEGHVQKRNEQSKPQQVDHRQQQQQQPQQQQSRPPQHQQQQQRHQTQPPQGQQQQQQKQQQNQQSQQNHQTRMNESAPLKQPVAIPPSLSSEEDDLYEECTVDAFLSKKSNVMAPKVEATSSNTSSGRIVERVGGVSEGKGRKNGKTGDTNMRGPPRQRDEGHVQKRNEQSKPQQVDHRQQPPQKQQQPQQQQQHQQQQQQQQKQQTQPPPVQPPAQQQAQQQAQPQAQPPLPSPPSTLPQPPPTVSSTTTSSSTPNDNANDSSSRSSSATAVLPQAPPPISKKIISKTASWADVESDDDD